MHYNSLIQKHLQLNPAEQPSLA